MIRDKRTVTYIAIALIVGVALAFAVALSRTDSSANTLSQTQIDAAAAASQAVLADDALAADPAKKQPSLDEFTSKDPFVPLDVANTSGTGTNTDTGSTTNSGLSAKVTVNGTSYTVTQGDKVPDSNAVFEISGISSNDVTFKLINGQFTDGSSTVTIAVGDSMKVTNQDTSTEYTLKVVSVGSATTSVSQGHSISVLSVNSQNGVAVATLEVDGQTYSDKEVGDTFSTGWGQIKILAINVEGQTVTVMHGDATITLHAGQVVVK